MDEDLIFKKLYYMNRRSTFILVIFIIYGIFMLLYNKQEYLILNTEVSVRVSVTFDEIKTIVIDNVPRDLLPEERNKIMYKLTLRKKLPNEDQFTDTGAIVHEDTYKTSYELSPKITNTTTTFSIIIEAKLPGMINDYVKVGDSTHEDGVDELDYSEHITYTFTEPMDIRLNVK